MNRQREHQTGFTLLEVVVAFAIAAIALGVLAQIFGNGARHLSRSRDYGEAMTLADGLLARYGIVASAEPRIVKDSNDKFEWSVSLQPYAPPGDEPVPQEDAPQSDLQLMRIDVTVTWHGYGKTRSVSLNSLRLAPRNDDDAGIL